MSFDALSKMSVGAAAGVVAERGGYVDHALSQLSDTYGTTAEAFGLPALPDAKGLVASNAETFRVPTSAAEASDFVAAGLKAARDMLQQYLPEAVKMPEVGASAERSADSLSASLAKANGEANKTLVTTGFFVAGFGVSAAVYSLYAFGPETLKTRVDKHYAITRRALHEISVRLDRKLRDANVKARLEKVNATSRRFVSTFRASVLDLIDASRKKRVAGSRRRGARRRGRRGGAAEVLARGVRGGRAGVPGHSGASQAEGGVFGEGVFGARETRVA
jgi:hypothetical protein